jgi:dihydroorotate dehydrogenase (NAD+) catalytic subunit
MTYCHEVEVAGLVLKNPTILAAGILGMTDLTLKRVADAGAGAVVTKSLGLKPSAGHQNPTVVQVACGLVNAMGLPNPGVKYFSQELAEGESFSVPLIVSIYGYVPSEYGTLAKRLSESPIDAFELNVSCPHAEKTGAEIGQDPKLITEVVKEVKKATSKPVIAKLPPHTSSIVELAKAAETAGADAITAINTVKAMVIDVASGKPILSNRTGGLSGTAIKPIGVQCVYELFDTVTIPIIGCGGISSWRDAIEYIQAGASAIQIGTGIATHGLKVFKSVADGIKIFLSKKGVNRVAEEVGVAHRR